MKKKPIATLLVMMLCLGLLAGCGGSADTSGEDERAGGRPG